jgi:hypothetical protein
VIFVIFRTKLPGVRVYFIFINNGLSFLKLKSISIKDFVREKKIRNRKKERAARAIFFMKLNTKPFKFKCGLANGGGGAGVPGGERAGRPMQGMGTPT